MGKEIVNQVQEAQRVPYRINPKRKMRRHILIELSKIKYKGKILKASREKQQITYQGLPIRLTGDLSAETLQGRRKDYYNKYYSTQQGSHLDSMEKLKPLQISKS